MDFGTSGPCLVRTFVFYHYRRKQYLVLKTCTLQPIPKTRGNTEVFQGHVTICMCMYICIYIDIYRYYHTIVISCIYIHKYINKTMKTWIDHDRSTQRDPKCRADFWPCESSSKGLSTPDESTIVFELTGGYNQSDCHYLEGTPTICKPQFINPGLTLISFMRITKLQL